MSTVKQTKPQVAPRNTVFLHHPHKPDEQPVELENTGETLTPYMVRGYVQYHPPVSSVSPATPASTSTSETEGPKE